MNCLKSLLFIFGIKKVGIGIKIITSSGTKIRPKVKV